MADNLRQLVSITIRVRMPQCNHGPSILKPACGAVSPHDSRAIASRSCCDCSG